MNPRVTFPEKVKLQDIDTEDDIFSISFPKNDEKLKASIKELGLLKPLILRSKGGGKLFHIISGYKRSIALKELGINFVPAYIFNADELGDEKALRFSLLENLHTREINCIEVSNFLHNLKENLKVKEEKITEDYLPLLGLEKSTLILKKYLSLQNLVNGFKELAVIKKIPVKILSRLSFLPKKDQESVLKIATKLELGFNLISGLLTLLEEVSERDKVSISDLTADKSIADILERDGSSRDKKTKLLIAFLNEKRFPNLEKFERKIKSHINNLKLPNNVAIDIPENLEGDAVAVRFKFGDKKEYEEILNSLLKISDSGDYKKLLEMI